MTFDKILPHLRRGGVAVLNGIKYSLEGTLCIRSLDSLPWRHFDITPDWFMRAMTSNAWEIEYQYASSGKDALYALLVEGKTVKHKYLLWTYNRIERDGIDICAFDEQKNNITSSAVIANFDRFSQETNWEILHD